MSWAKQTIIGLLILFFLSSIQASAQQQQCTLSLQDQVKGSHVVVEICKNIGVFSFGGYYDGQWEKLTYRYPIPWPGTFMSVNVDGKLYSTSSNPNDEISMDQYVISSPKIDGNQLKISWKLPEDVVVEEIFSLIQNGTTLTIKIKNEDSAQHRVGVRLHLDTMLAENDGAPIYIPGDGLRAQEKEYFGDTLDFRYWKAYDRWDDPSIVAYGSIDPNLGLTYPEKVVMANWKKSNSASSWDYTVTPGQSILGDSALILYYPIETINPSESREIKTSYGNEEPLTQKVGKGGFGITEIVTDKVSGNYCPGSDATIKVDVLAIKKPNSGVVTLEISNSKGDISYTSKKNTNEVSADSVETVIFGWKIPETKETYGIKAILADKAGNILDEKVAAQPINADPNECPITKTLVKDLSTGMISIIVWLLPLLLILILLGMVGATVIYVVVQARKGVTLHALITGGEVVVEKTKKGELAKVTVTNKTRNTLKNCTVEDTIPQGAEVDISTIDVIRRGSEVIWEVGDVLPSQSIVLEYEIRGVNVLPSARVIWERGEKISN
ncbi:MAG: hypothetical protein ABH950_02010 [Candidatus Altiarchaeota archaeon]